MYFQEVKGDKKEERDRERETDREIEKKEERKKEREGDIYKRSSRYKTFKKYILKRFHQERLMKVFFYTWVIRTVNPSLARERERERRDRIKKGKRDVKIFLK